MVQHERRKPSGRNDFLPCATAGTCQIEDLLHLRSLAARPRKFEVTLLNPTDTRTLHTAIYTRWGEPVLIKAPPAAQTATLTDNGLQRDR